MPYIERAATARLRRLMRAFPAVVVTGARQTGKSTLVKHWLGARGDLVVFDPVADVAGARQDADLFLRHRLRPLALDEVQHAPEVVAALKRQIDRDRRPGQYLLTGSQQWGLLRRVSESLAGRVVFLTLEGFSLAELRRTPGRSWLADWLRAPRGVPPEPSWNGRRVRPTWEQIWRGWLPEAQFLKLGDLPDFHAAYQRTYVERDIRVMANVSDWQAFGRFTRLAAALTAQEVNRNEFGRELGLHPETAGRWLDMLKAAFQWHEVSPFSGNAIKRLSGRPKGYLADTGAACALQAISSPQVLGGHPLGGPLFETAVVGELRRQTALLSPPPALYHWRAHSGPKVDLVLERDGVLYPVEIKATSHPTPRDAQGMAAFRATYRSRTVAPGVVIAPCERFARLTDDAYAVPWAGL